MPCFKVLERFRKISNVSAPLATEESGQVSIYSVFLCKSTTAERAIPASHGTSHPRIIPVCPDKLCRKRGKLWPACDNCIDSYANQYSTFIEGMEMNSVLIICYWYKWDATFAL